MDEPEPIIQSEVNQKEKNKYRILTQIREYRKMVTDEPISAQQWRYRCREQACGYREEGEGGTDGESSMETSTLPYVTLIASGNFQYDSGSSIWNSVTT